MKAFVSAIVALAVISGATWAMFGERMQTSTSAEFSTPFVRQGDKH